MAVVAVLCNVDDVPGTQWCQSSTPAVSGYTHAREPIKQDVAKMFISKYLKTATLDCECLWGIYHDCLTIDTVCPTEYWNPLNKTVQLPSMEAKKRSGVLISTYPANMRPQRQCSFAISFNINGSNTSVSVHIINRTEIELIVWSPELLYDVAMKYMGENRSDRVDLPLDPARRDRAVATIKKVHVVKQSVWSFELHISSLPGCLTSIRY